MLVVMSNSSSESTLENPNYQNQRVLVVGGSGFIGQHLVKQLLEMNYRVTVYTRNLSKTKSIFLSAYVEQELTITDEILSSEHYQIIINLAGKPLDESRWNDRVKEQILASRIDTTEKIIHYIRQTENKPELLINGSAIGFYGPRGSEKLTEQSDGTTSFSHQLCQSWERQALLASESGVRVCLLRTGVVLGKDGGALASMLTPFKLGLGGPIGNGQQYMSWIHIEDLVSLIIWLMTNQSIDGPVNGVAPSAVTNEQFSQTLASILKRPCMLRMPGFMVRLLFGEMADELLLKGQRVVPEVALSNDFTFHFPVLGHALENLLLPPPS